MNVRQCSEWLDTLIGKKFTSIGYVATQFYHKNLHGNWTNVNPDSFVLHAREWQLHLSDRRKFFLTNPQTDLGIQTSKSNITVSNYSDAKSEEDVLPVPDNFHWKDILDKEIEGYYLYRCLIKESKVFGLTVNKRYQENIQIIQIYISGTTFFLTTLNGDLGNDRFYPTGTLGERIGVFFNKLVMNVEASTMKGIVRKFEVVYKRRGENREINSSSYLT